MKDPLIKLRASLTEDAKSSRHARIALALLEALLIERKASSERTAIVMAAFEDLVRRIEK